MFARQPTTATFVRRLIWPGDLVGDVHIPRRHHLRLLVTCARRRSTGHRQCKGGNQEHAAHKAHLRPLHHNHHDEHYNAARAKLRLRALRPRTSIFTQAVNRLPRGMAIQRAGSKIEGRESYARISFLPDRPARSSSWTARSRRLCQRRRGCSVRKANPHWLRIRGVSSGPDGEAR